MTFYFTYNVPVDNQPAWLQDPGFTLNIEAMYLYDSEVNGHPHINCSIVDMSIPIARKVKDWCRLSVELDALALKLYNREKERTIKGMSCVELAEGQLT